MMNMNNELYVNLNTNNNNNKKSIHTIIVYNIIN